MEASQPHAAALHALADVVKKEGVAPAAPADAAAASSAAPAAAESSAVAAPEAVHVVRRRA